MRRLLLALVVGLVAGSGWAGLAQETPLTPIANLRGRTNASGYLLVALSPAPAPTGAQYWVGAADGDLTGEHNLGVLATGLVLNTTGTPSAYAGSSTCTATEFIRGLSASGVATCATDSGGAPTDAGYWVDTANATLSAERNLGGLTTALVLNTVTAGVGVPSAYTGVTCTNQFLRVLSAVGAGTCADVTLTTDTAGNYAASVAGTANRIAVSGAVGEGQAAVVDISTAYVGQATLTTLGTITTGTWTGTAIAFANGGTGLTTAADDTALLSTGTAWAAVAVTNCVDTGGNHLNYTAATNAFSCGTSGSGVQTLLTASSGSTTTATAENVATVAISGLTAKDTLLIYYTMKTLVQPTANPQFYNSTDSVVLAKSQSGNGLVVANLHFQGSALIRQAQTGNTEVVGSTVDGYSTFIGGHNENATVTTVWTGAWTLAFRHGGVTAGGTFTWSWAVYKVAGQ